MIIDLWAFIAKYNGKRFEYDGIYPYQCVDLTKAYFEFLGKTVRRGNAIDYKNFGYGKEWRWVANTLWNFPNPGDVVVFNTGVYGHVGIVVHANRLTLDVFSQNWPVGNVCSVKRFNYLSPRVLGWLQPI